MFYVLTAAIVNRNDSGYAYLGKIVHSVARRQSTGMIHASDMARTQSSLKDLISLEREIGGNSSVRALAVVRYPLGSDGEERARKRCVAELMVALVSGFGVSSVTMDSRDPLGRASESRTPRRGSRNYEDFMTIEDLKAVGELPKDLEVSHGNDRLKQGLWIADVATYAVDRSLADRDPSRLQWIAPHLHMREALTLPVSERTDSGKQLSPATEMSSFLNDFVQQARIIHDEENGE